MKYRKRGSNMKGIIIAAGYGTRFLPASKTIPKEMFPLIDIPAIDFIIDEFADSGIKDILIVTSRRKKALEDYFDREVELEAFFTKKGDNDKLEKIKARNLNIFFVRQIEMLGTGQAILLAKDFAGNDPFIVAYPDDIVFSDTPLSKQLMDINKKTGSSVMAIQEMTGDVSRYGVMECSEKNGLIRVERVVEKPKPGQEPSKMISVGRYLFTPELMPLLEKDFKKHSGGEFYHIDAINALANEGKMCGCKFEGTRIDIGEKLGYFEGIVRYVLDNNELKDAAKGILKKYI
jgi:UTP--glucose-1-phosphate uridylyltransferase